MENKTSTHLQNLELISELVEQIRITNFHISTLVEITARRGGEDIETIADCMRTYVNEQHEAYEKLAIEINTSLSLGGK